jgi:GH25 family lysozyme M1 (1,4-beta-N-acetylmuramidase)
MKQLCAPGPTIKFIDIYHGDYIEDTNEVIAAGFIACYLKAWENSEDSSFASRWTAIKGKMYRGAYDFFHPEHDAIKQAKAFCALLGDLDDQDLPPMLDWETSGGTSSQGDREAGYAWLQTVEKLTGRIPIIYGSPAFLQALRLDVRFKRYGLYVANYGVKCPQVPPPWDMWTAWQYGETGKVPGMRGNCDVDVFSGDVPALEAYIQSTIIT